MRHYFIINPVAGKHNDPERLADVLSEKMTARGLEHECVFTEYPMHAEGLARAAAETGESIHIYACGGDGTLNEVINGAAGFPNAAVTQIPTGSGNDFLKMFGDAFDSFLDIDALLDYGSAPFDLIDCAGRMSVNICSVGFDARIGLGMVKYKKWPLVSGKAAYIISAVVNTIKGVHLPYRITAPGLKLDGDYSLIVAANGRYYGGSFNPTPDAEPDDGLIDLLIVDKCSRATVLSLIGRFAKGRYKEFPELMHLYRCRELCISPGRDTEVNVDGEMLVCKEAIKMKISETKVNIFFPKGAKYSNLPN